MLFFFPFSITHHLRRRQGSSIMYSQRRKDSNHTLLSSFLFSSSSSSFSSLCSFSFLCLLLPLFVWLFILFINNCPPPPHSPPSVHSPFFDFFYLFLSGLFYFIYKQLCVINLLLLYTLILSLYYAVSIPLSCCDYFLYFLDA